MYDLDRFVDAQDEDYETALFELKRGRKQSHWIWYIFPQLASLGYSYRAKFYGLDDLDEARAYLDHPVLGPRYLTCVEILLAHADRPIRSIMGSDVDVDKLLSSLTLMQRAGGGDRITDAIALFYEGRTCPKTNDMLSGM